MKKEEFDSLFDQAFEESVQNHNFTPDAGPSWEKLQLKLAKKRRRKSQLRALPYVAAAFLLGAFLFGTPTASNAFQPLFKAVVTIKDDVVRIMFGEDNASKTVPKTPPPPEQDNVSVQQSKTSDGTVVSESLRFTLKSWEEAIPYLDFNAPEIHYIAEDYHLYEVILNYEMGEQTPRRTIITYSDDEGILYTITFYRVRPNSIFQSGGGPSIDMKTSKIDNIETYIFTTNDGYVAQEFMIDDIHVSINGPLSHEETRIISEEIIKGMTLKS